MPLRLPAPRWTALLLVAACAPAVPAAAATGACGPAAPTGAGTLRFVPLTPPGGVVIRLGATRPRCAQLALLPRSRVRIHAEPGGALRITRPGAVTVRIRPGRVAVRVVAEPRLRRLVVTWPHHRWIIPAALRAETRVLVRRTTTAPAMPGTPAVVSVQPVPAPGAAPGTPTPAPAAATRPATLFASDSVWNRRVEGATVDPDSAAVTADLRAQALDTGTWMNTTAWSVPVYVVGPDVPTVVVLDSDDGEMNLPGPWRWGRVPLPATAVAAGPHPGDNHLVVWQPATDTMWEFWSFTRVNGVPRSPHGARIDGVSHGQGSVPSPYGATASGIPAAAGMVTARDLSRGVIDHALVIGVPQVRAGEFRAPATRTDGTSTRATAPVMGAHFRLDPAVDVNALGLPRLARMVALAAQRYGLVVRDTAGSVTFYGEDPVATGTNPFPAALAGGEMGEVMRTFPWQHVQLLAP